MVHQQLRVCSGATLVKKLVFDLPPRRPIHDSRPGWATLVALIAQKWESRHGQAMNWQLHRCRQTFFYAARDEIRAGAGNNRRSQAGTQRDSKEAFPPSLEKQELNPGKQGDWGTARNSTSVGVPVWRRTSCYAACKGRPTVQPEGWPQPETGTVCTKTGTQTGKKGTSAVCQ